MLSISRDDLKTIQCSNRSHHHDVSDGVHAYNLWLDGKLYWDGRNYRWSRNLSADVGTQPRGQIAVPYSCALKRSPLDPMSRQQHTAPTHVNERITEGEYMAVQVRILGMDYCDHCKKIGGLLVSLKWRDVNHGSVQLWLHRECLNVLTKKADKQLSEV
jgi:hypothetical protein